MSKDDSTFPKKWATKLPEGHAEKAESLSNEDLKKKIVEWEQTISGAEKDMEADDHLASLKEEVKEVAGTYKTTMVTYRAMIRHAVFLLETRGQA